MRKRNIIISAFALFLSVGAFAQSEHAHGHAHGEKVKGKSPKGAKVVQMEAKSGSKLQGTATFKEKKGVVELSINVTGVAAGEHAVHIHQNADCSAADGMSAGGHWNPTSKSHGQWGATEGHHAGDIGNLVVDDKGNGKLKFSTDQWCLSCDDATKKLVGHSVIIHAGVDDFKTQPTGNAGGRIGCGVIK